MVVGLKLDCYHLEYFKTPFHFAGHYVAIYGYGMGLASLVDTKQQGSLVNTSLESLSLARAEKGPMASKNLYYTLSTTNNKYDLRKSIQKAIVNNAKRYLNPPINNISYKGILKTCKEIEKWFKTSTNIEEFGTVATLMERAGTGGALFRNLYRDFLKESYEILELTILKDSYEEFKTIAELWTNVSTLFVKVSETKDIMYIHQCSEVLKELSIKEKNIMERLLKINPKASLNSP